MKTIILEINEVPEKVLHQFIVENKSSNLSKYFVANKIYKKSIINDDVCEKDLYPSQVWATVHTGKPYDEHGCYWYSDPLKDETILEKVIKSGKSVAAIGVLHSSKIQKEALDRPSIKLFIPDAFGDINKVYPRTYTEFVKLNNEITSASGRRVRLQKLVFQSLKFAINTIKKPISNGITIKSLYLTMKTIAKIIKYSEVELIRTLQYVYQSAILVNTIREERPDVSILFSNHIAANMHRYWAATWPEEFDKPMYTKKWLSKKSRIIDYSLWLLDDLIGDIFSMSKKDTIIILCTGMGQKANKTANINRMYDGKIQKMELFMSRIREYIELREGREIPLKQKNNMEPQYGISCRTCEEAEIAAQLIREFCAEERIKHKIDINKCELVITIDFYKEEYTIKQMRKLYGNLGFEFFNVTDHHTGKHSKKGILWTIDPERILSDTNHKKEEIKSTEVRKILEDIILT
ncbi:hypothetical protein [Synechococcus sp. RS9916]|uniref:hypothetical protein n=1 Tax=Synechococcus sp. RS9916 TaxID=221359 RepID=UPI0000E535B3|nr:hypothetical protein [Synechococcus sp. RS9916]EAU75555.1 hypothetical protein RS9916_38647 [Synechococcus sp. RS9916]